MIRASFILLTLALPVCAGRDIATDILGPLLDPAKVATLKGDRPINTRLYRVLGWLETARQAGGDVSRVIDAAHVAAGYAGTASAKADKLAISGNREKLESFGCFTPEGVAELKKEGQSKNHERRACRGKPRAGSRFARRGRARTDGTVFQSGGNPRERESSERREDHGAGNHSCPTVEPQRVAFGGGTGSR